MSDAILRTFPGLTQDDVLEPSPPSRQYNCIAWAIGDTERWWWPDNSPYSYWPAGVRGEVTVDAFIHALGCRGFMPCGGPELEAGYERVALFIDAKGRPTHAARQLPDGRWTSKLGPNEDITHSLLHLEGTRYGKVHLYLRRPLRRDP